MGFSAFMFCQRSEEYTPQQKEDSFCKGSGQNTGNTRKVMKYCIHGYFLDKCTQGLAVQTVHSSHILPCHWKISLRFGSAVCLVSQPSFVAGKSQHAF